MREPAPLSSSVSTPTTRDHATTGPHEVADERRAQIGADLARTVLAETARRLAEATAEYEAALDRRALLAELQRLDREVARAERDLEAAHRDHGTARRDHGAQGGARRDPGPT